MPALPLRCLLLCGFLVAAPCAQNDAPRVPPDPGPEALARSLTRWSTALAAGRIRGGDLQPIALDNHPIYGPASRQDLVRRFVPTSHLDLLQILLQKAEDMPAPPVFEAVLSVAALGYDERSFDHQLVQARELAHWTLMRTEAPQLWSWLRTVVAPQGGERVDPRMRSAALALLGQRNDPQDRMRIEGALAARDARVRLAAAEALERMRRPASIEAALDRFRRERHAVVSQALVRAVHAMLRRRGTELDEEQLTAIVGRLLHGLKERDWRTQRAVVHVVQRFPVRAAIPALIDILERCHRPTRVTTSTKVSPVLAHSTWQVLCAVTGAGFASDKPAEWRAFWEREGGQLEIRPDTNQQRRTTARPTLSSTRIRGREVVFLIDTSHSMKKLKPDPRSPDGAPRTRLQLAVDEVTRAIQGLPQGCRYHLLTFAQEVTDWTPRGVVIGKRSDRALTARLEGLQARGGTDLWSALRAALDRDGKGAFARGRGVEEIYVVTDGYPSKGEVNDPERILAMVKELNRFRQIPIHAVFAGGGDGEEFLRELAKKTGGTMLGW